MLMNGISDLIQETPENPFCHVTTQWEMVMYETGSQLSPNIESALTLILDFLASRNVRNKCWLLKPPSLWYFLLQQLEQSKIPTLYLCWSTCSWPSTVLLLEGICDASKTMALDLYFSYSYFFHPSLLDCKLPTFSP